MIIHLKTVSIEVIVFSQSTVIEILVRNLVPDPVPSLSVEPNIDRIGLRVHRQLAGVDQGSRAYRSVLRRLIEATLFFICAIAA